MYDKQLTHLSRLQIYVLYPVCDLPSSPQTQQELQENTGHRQLDSIQ